MAAKTTLQRAVQAYTKVTKGNGHNRVLRKVQLTSIDKGKCCGSFVVSEEHENRRGSLHGGFTATLMDSFTYIALITSEHIPGATINLDLSYFRPAKRGDEVVITAECLKIEKTVAFCSAEILNKDGNILVQGNVQYMLQERT